MTGLAAPIQRADGLAGPRRTRRTGVRVMGVQDLPAVTEILQRRPLHHLFIASRIASLKTTSQDLGRQIVGYERDGELLGVCHAGTNLMPVTIGDAAVDAFASHFAQRRSHSIAGNSETVLELWSRLRRQVGSGWEQPRDVRPRQPLMVIDSDPAVAPHPEVGIADLVMLQPYFAAAVKMYTEEVGIDPTQPSPHSYRNHVRTLINHQHAFAVVRERQVIFKADIGPTAHGCCQIQGVWLDPRFRGAGLAPSMMAAVVAMARQRYPTVSLYVNDFNHAAIATYRRVGFRTIGELATVLY